MAAASCKLYFMNQQSLPADPTFDLWFVWSCTRLIQTLAIITARVPYLKPFMDSLEYGGLRADNQRRRGTNRHGHRYGYAYYDMNRSSR